MQTLLQKIQKAIQALLRQQSTTETPTLSVPLMRLQKLAQMLILTEELELNCQDVYDVIDQYVDFILQDKDASNLMPLVQHHLKMCVDCHEEYQLLLAMLQAPL